VTSEIADPDDLVDLALEHHEAGRLDEAEQLYLHVLKMDPTHPGALFFLGGIAYGDGRLEFAHELISHALAHQPDDPEALYLMGLIERQRAEPAAAIEYLQRAVALLPTYLEARYALGELLRQENRLDEAVASLRAAVVLDPGHVLAHCELGIALQTALELEEAAASYRRALALDPKLVAAIFNLAQIRQAQGHLDEAVDLYRSELAIRPNAISLTNLGTVLYEQHKLAQSIDSYRQALMLDPETEMAHNNLGVALCDQGRLDDAVASYRRAIAIRFDYAEAHRNLGAALKEQGQLEAAVACFRQALALKPDYVETFSDYLMTLQYLPDVTREELFEEHIRYGECFEAPLRASWPRHDPAQHQPAGKLRSGFLSGDLHMHPIGFFLENALRHIDRGRFEIVLYANSEKNDALTGRLRAMGFAWVPVLGLSDADTAQRIRDDAIDILVDLSGHTGANRLPVFARKPAPIQATWLGYWATTGLRAMDYVICDRYGVPADERRFFLEQPWYLPDTRLCFTPPAEPVPVAALPALEHGSITFGCFNNLTKMTAPVVAAWARILRDVDGSRLLLKSGQLATVAVRDEVQARFAAHGIPARQIMFEDSSGRAEYFTAYNRIDIALDPFPFTGGTTSIEGLWMGVPVLTLRGDRMIAHQGEAILHNIGLEDWIAEDIDDYVRQALERAADLTALARLRGELRARLLISPLCDGPAFARNLDEAFTGMWKKYCSQ
jgi:predicted O-linked N-acetylglucosamine transferase (SPINDLY family)